MDSSDLATKENLAEILKNLNVNHSHIVETHKGLIVFCNNINDADFIVSETTCDILEQCKLKPIISEEVKAARSVIFKPRDFTLLNVPPEEIKNELNNKNDLKVDAVYIIKEIKSIKIKFTEVYMTKVCRKKGLRLFSRYIPAHNISNEEHIKLKSCYVCYEWEDHVAKDCPKKRINPNYKICPKCSRTDHTYNHCDVPQNQFKCIWCRESHHTLAYRCKIRKNFVNLKRKGQLPSSYASVTRKNSNLHENVTPKQDRSDVILTCICAAMIKNDEEPGCFNTVLNSLLGENQLPSVKMSQFAPPKLSETSIGNLFKKYVPNPIKDSNTQNRNTLSISRGNHSDESNWNNINTNRRDLTAMVENNKTENPELAQPAPVNETSRSASDATITVPRSDVIAPNTATVPTVDDGVPTPFEEEVLSEQTVQPLVQTSISTSTPRQEKTSVSRLNASQDSQNYLSCHEIDEPPTLDWSSFTIFKLGNVRKKLVAGEVVNKIKKNELIVIDANDTPPSLETIETLLNKHGVPPVKSLRENDFQKKLKSLTPSNLRNG